MLSVVATILTVGCGRPNSPVLLCGEEQPGSAVARPDTVSLEELAGASPQQGAQFFEERGNLTKLTSLYLNGNQLTALPTEIGNLTKLTSLYLYNNQLTALPTEIRNLIKLKELNLNDNQLPCLSANLHPWLQRRRLTASKNPWWKPDELSKISYEALEQIAEEQRGIVFFERDIPFYLERQLCTTTDVDKLLEDLKNKQLYCLDHQLCTTTDVDKLLEDLENKQLYRFGSEAQFKELDLVFDLKFLPQAGVANEVMADIIRSLDNHHLKQVKTLTILGSTDNH